MSWSIIEAAVESIRKCVAEAEAMAKCDVEQVYVGLAGAHIRSCNSQGAVPVAARSREITSDDVRRVIENARAIPLTPDREIIHILPQEFTVDEQTGIADPMGMVGTRLEVNVHIVTSSTTAAQNIVTAVNRSGLLVGDTVLEQMAAGESVLSEDEKELGVVLVDIGGGKPTSPSTTMARCGTRWSCRSEVNISPTISRSVCELRFRKRSA